MMALANVVCFYQLPITREIKMTELQKKFIESKARLKPHIEHHEPSGYIQIQASGREAGINWKRTWTVSPTGKVFAPDTDWDGHPGQH
jgi:hypothetical protein